MPRDTGVDVHSDTLSGKRVLVLVTGGIAAVESVRLTRELRRHQAELTVMMSKEATKIITPLALAWASDVQVIYDWTPEMAQLEPHDIVLIAPATRNTISKHIHGIIDSPLMMALSAARGRGGKMCFVPSMHQDLFDDPVTQDLLDDLRAEGVSVLVSSVEEGKRKQPDPVSIVAAVCHQVNSNSSRSKRIAITLGANRAPIDAVRAIQNASSGRTGWMIAEYLHRLGHEIICVAGKTSAHPSFSLPDVRRAGEPDEMLSCVLDLAQEDPSPDVWIHAAAVLDYFTKSEVGKRASGDESWELTLKPGLNHIAELSEHVKGAVRIGFKLETGVDVSTLIQRAKDQIERSGVDAVVANLMEEMNEPDSLRARIVHADSTIEEIEDGFQLCSALRAIIDAV